jgi:hypothetical protein
MKLAVMQPYFMPYIGYWQLLAAVDKFIVLDDVAFIRRGWIHRNRLLVNGAPHLFTIPVRDASQNKLICEIELANYQEWCIRFAKTLKQNYGRAPHYAVTMELMEPIFVCTETNLSRFIMNATQCIIKRFDISTQLVMASENNDNRELAGQQRIIDFCQAEKASSYLNLQGGMQLYERHSFAAAGIQLDFLVPDEIQYSQQEPGFVPWLSVIDILMNVGEEGFRSQLGRFRLV